MTHEIIDADRTKSADFIWELYARVFSIAKSLTRARKHSMKRGDPIGFQEEERKEEKGPERPEDAAGHIE